VNSAASFAELPKIGPESRTCVRWNPEKKRYELVVGGVVLAHISRLGMTLRSEKQRFRAACAAVQNVVARHK
jgi:hypothetical protein